MKKLKDENGNEFGYLPFDLTEGAESPVITLSVLPTIGAVFKSDSHASARLLARETGSGAPFVELANGIDLSGYPPGIPALFDVKAEALSVDSQKTCMLWLGVVESSAAGWDV